MSDLAQIIIAVSAALTGLVSAVLAGLAAIFAAKARNTAGEAKTAAVKTQQEMTVNTEVTEAMAADLKTTKEHINSKMDDLVKAVAGQKLAEGTLAGVKQEQDRTAEKPSLVQSEVAAPTPVPVTVVNPSPVPVQVIPEPKKK